MNTNTIARSLRLLPALLLAALLAACAATTGSQSAEEAPPPPPQFEPWDGDGMEIPLDGSSLEAFESSVARVKAYSSEKDYITFDNAIEYLMLYDLSVRKDKARLAKKLDGMTPYEVLEMVQWRKPAPGKSQAEKGAADATIEL